MNELIETESPFLTIKIDHKVNAAHIASDYAVLICGKQYKLSACKANCAELFASMTLSRYMEREKNTFLRYVFLHFLVEVLPPPFPL